MVGKGKILQQYAALPYLLEDGYPQVLLVTSRDGKRWILPKGQIEKGLPPHRIAEQEAFEEAGVLGNIADKPVGSFADIKRPKGTGEVPTQVTVYPLLVTKILDIWPEKSLRERRWMGIGQAAMTVNEAPLISLLLAFGSSFD